MDAVKLLTQDHRTVDRLFDRYESLEVGADKERKRIVEEIVRELSIHAAIEEQVLYPSIRDLLPDGDLLAEEALDEHQEVKETLAELEKMGPSDAGFDMRVRRLIQDVRHHASEEESEMFPKLASAVPKKKLEEMGTRMDKAKLLAPTRPHPHAPNTPPGNLVAGTVAAVVDLARDVVTGRAKPKRASSRKKVTGKKTSRKAATRKGAASKRTVAKKTTAKKATARKTGGRKSTAKKTTAKKTTAKKTSARKTSSRKTTKTSSRKSPARKSSARKSSSSSSRKSGGRKTTGRKSTSGKSSTRRTSG